MKLQASGLGRVGLLAAMLHCWVGVGQTFGASIGIFSTPDCSICSLNLQAGGSVQIYIAADMTGMRCPLGVVEFRITGLPSGWTAVSVPNPTAAVVIGDPFGPSGTDIAFPGHPPGTCINLFTTTLSADAFVSDVRLKVEMANPPSSPQYPCPSILTDCGPVIDWICVGGGQMLVNSQDPCTVGTDPISWSRVKTLYK